MHRSSENEISIPRPGRPCMMLTTQLRKFSLSLHLTFSIGWIGAVAAFLALAVAGVTGHDVRVVRAAYLLMPLLISYVIVPLAFTSLVTGLVLSLGTKWGLCQYYWVVIKFLLTSFAVIILLVQIGPINRLAALATDPTWSGAVVLEAKRPLVHAVGGLMVLLVVQVLGIYKPWGMTPYGSRKQQVRTAESAQ